MMPSPRQLLRASVICLAVTVGLLLLAVAPVHCQTVDQPVDHKPLFVLLAGSATDGALSLYAFSQGAQELNPLLKHGGTAGFVLGKVATTAALSVIVVRLQRTHPTAAKRLGYVLGGSLLATAALDFYAVRQ